MLCGCWFRNRIRADKGKIKQYGELLEKIGVRALKMDRNAMTAFARGSACAADDLTALAASLVEESVSALTRLGGAPCARDESDCRSRIMCVISPTPHHNA